MRLKVLRARAVTTAAAILLPLGLTACVEDAVTDVTADRPILNLLVAPGAAALPGGTSALAGIRINNFDVAVPDAFDRSTGETGLYRIVPYNGGNYYGVDVRSAFRNASQDPRAPLLAPSNAGVGSWFGFYPPIFGGKGPGVWDLWGLVTGLEPGTPYTLVFARMALQVNGQLDQAQRLTGFPVNARDSLYFLGGTPSAAYAGGNCAFGTPTPVTADMNPVVLGQRVANDDGNAEFDCVPQATGNSPWFRNEDAGVPAENSDSLPSGQNTVTGTVVPGQYNYVLIYEGSFAPGDVSIFNGSPIARAQVGPDIDANGNIINNGYAPFPTAITSTATFKDLPGGGPAFAAPSQITLNLNSLPVLGGGSAYQVFLFSAETGQYQAVPVTVRVDGETVAEGAATFASPGEGESVQLVLNASDAIDFGSFNSIVVSIESAAGATTPSGSQFLFTEYLTEEQALQSGALTLGAFGGDESRAFRIAGSGGASFFSDSLIVQLVGLVEPPAGFHYQSYLINQVGPNITAELRLHTLDTDELGRVRDAIDQSEVTGGFAAFNTYVVVLEPDGAPGLGLAQIQVSENYLDKFGDFFSTE